MQEIIVNSERLDLYVGGDERFIGLTLNFTDLRNISSKRGNVTNVFKVPATAHNNKVFKNGNIIPYNSGVFTKIFKCHYFEDGICLVENGLLNITKITSTDYEIRINGGATNFFDFVSTSRTVGDLFCQDYSNSTNDPYYNFDNPAWRKPDYIYADVANMGSGWAYPKEIVFPVMNWTNEAETIDSSNILRVQAIEPAIRVSAILSRMAQLGGYTGVGDFLNTTAFKNQAILPDIFDLYSQFVYPEDIYTAPPAFPVVLEVGSEDYSVTPFTVTNTLGNDSYSEGSTPTPVGTYPEPYVSPWDYSSDFNSSVFGTMNIALFGRIGILKAAPAGLLKKDVHVWAELYELGGFPYTEKVIASFKIIDWSGKYTGANYFDIDTAFSCTTWYKSTRRYCVRYRWRFEGATQDPTLEIKLNEIQYIFNQELNRKTSDYLFFPYLNFTMKQSDFLKDFMDLNGLMISVNEPNKTVEFIRYSDIIKNLSKAPEWEYDELLGFEIVTDESLSQKVYFKFKDTDLNSGYVELNNPLLQEESNLVELKSGTVSEVNQNGQPMASLPIDTNGYKPKGKTIFVQLEAVNTPITTILNEWDDSYTPAGDMCVARVYGNYPLTFDQNVPNSLTNTAYAYVKKAYEDLKIIDVYVKITAKEVSQLDLTTPIRLISPKVNGYYMIAKIDKFKTGLNKVTLQKINL